MCAFVGDEGAEALAAAVAASTSLKRLGLTGNPVSSGQLQVVAHVLKTREYKMCVHMDGLDTSAVNALLLAAL